YYRASTPPCPGSAFFQVASSTASPPPNRTVTFRLTGLAAGTVYNVSITAVDTGNNESTCSTFASAAARIEFGLSPTGTVTFGGTASDNVGVTQVAWTNSAGGTGTASGTASWTASGITLKLGTNVLTVTARDAAGNTGTARLTVTLSGSFSFTDDPLAAQGT